VSIPADPGVSAPTGDPDGLLAAASWHENPAAANLMARDEPRRPLG
jgi:hypothetical protein